MEAKTKTIQKHFVYSQINRANTNFFWCFRRQSKQHISILHDILLFSIVYTNILIVVLIHNIV